MGGAAVVYRHAAGLAARGHEMTVAAPKGDGRLRGRAMRAAVRVRDVIHRVENAPLLSAPGVVTLEPDRWQDLDASHYDAVIATGHQTSSWVANLTESSESHGVYFLQGDERDLSDRAGETWALPLARIAVSEWVATLVRDHGYPVLGVIPNAVDPADFTLTTPVSDRPPSVVALYHRHPVKGPDTLISALHRIRDARPDVTTTVLAARPPSHRLPDGVDVEIRPAADRLCQLFNASAVCLHTSRSEGWALVPMEAAACGCAVAATASRGPREYLTDGASMLEVPVGDGIALADTALRLLNDETLRVRIAEAGVRDVAGFSWAESTARLERLLLDIIGAS